MVTTTQNTSMLVPINEDLRIVDEQNNSQVEAKKIGRLSTSITLTSSPLLSCLAMILVFVLVESRKKPIPK